MYVFTEYGFRDSLPNSWDSELCDSLHWLLTVMSSPKREAHGKGFSKSAINQRKRGNRVNSSSDFSFNPVASHTQSHEYLTSLWLPPFRQESLPSLSVVKLPQLVSKVGIELSLRESPWNDGPRFVASAFSADIPVKILNPSGVTFT